MRYYFDRGVFIFGRNLESELDAAGHKAEQAHKKSKSRSDPSAKIRAARMLVLSKFLDRKAPETKAYRDPSGIAVKAEFSA